MPLTQPGERALATGNTVANAGTSVDRRDEDQESQHGTFLGPGLGLEGLILEAREGYSALTHDTYLNAPRIRVGCTIPSQDISGAML